MATDHDHPIPSPPSFKLDFIAQKLHKFFVCIWRIRELLGARGLGHVCVEGASCDRIDHSMQVSRGWNCCRASLGFHFRRAVHCSRLAMERSVTKGGDHQVSRRSLFQAGSTVSFIFSLLSSLLFSPHLSISSLSLSLLSLSLSLFSLFSLFFLSLSLFSLFLSFGRGLKGPRTGSRQRQHRE